MGNTLREKLHESCTCSIQIGALRSINNELTKALKNPEYPERARGIGVVPWKVAWAGDFSCKTHRKSKAEQEEKLRAIQEEMNRKVASLESQMDARVNEAVQLALSQRGMLGRTRML